MGSRTSRVAVEPSTPPARGGAALVLTGPVIGTVTESKANILLEVDESGTYACVATPQEAKGAVVVRATCRLESDVPGVFQLQNLSPGTEYKISFEGLHPAQSDELEARGCIVRTLPSNIQRLRFAAVSCDFPSQGLPWKVPKDWSPWRALAEPSARGEFDAVLHLGDQVYTWEHGRMLAAKRDMDLGLHPKTTPELRAKMKARASVHLQESYRNVWGQHWTAMALSHSSHLMIWSDNDVTNDFTIAYEADGVTQTYKADYLRVATRVYRLYQKQLRLPASRPELLRKIQAPLGPPPTAAARLSEWAEQAFGWCHVFMIDMRGNHIDEAGMLQPHAPTLSAAQRDALEAAFRRPELRCMVVCAEIPFVGPTPEGARAGAAKLPFLKEHWPYRLDELLWLLDLCFEWKAALLGREVVLLAGDIHVGVTSAIRDARTGLTIQHLTTSPITNRVSKFFNPLEGALNERYTYTHTVLDGLHNFADLDLRLADDGATVEAEVKLVGVPIPANE